MISLVYSFLFFHFLLPPFRGFDALWRYFPESLVYYQLNRIPLINYLDFRPITYEPVNTLLYTFTYYLTNDQNLIFIPPLFFVALLFLIYSIADFYFKDRKKAIISIILFCCVPVIYWMVQYWLYYQELYITYFFTVAVFYFIKYFSSMNISDIILSSIGLSLAILSKTSGWVLLPIILLLIPFGKYDKKVKTFLLIIYWLVLSYYASKITFFWLFIPLGMYTALLLYSLKNTPSSQDVTIKQRVLSIILVIVGTGIGGYWMFEILQRIPSGFQNPISIYFGGNSFQFNFPLITGGYNLILEHMHAADMITSVFIILFGVAFVPSWLIPKILGFFKSKDNFSLYVWILLPNMIWITEFGLVYSVRYIIMITIPLVILTTSGMYELWKRLKPYINSLPEEPSLVFIVLLVIMGIFIFYPTVRQIFFIKFPIIFVQFNDCFEQSFLFDAFWLYQLIVGLLSVGLIYYVLKFSRNSKTIFFNSLRLKLKHFPFIVYAFIFIIILSIVTAPFSILLVINDFNLEKTNAAFDPSSSNEYQDIVSYLINENIVNSTIFTVYVPGLSYFTNIPSINLIDDQDLIASLFTNHNVSTDLTLFHDPLAYFKQNYSITTPLYNPSLGYVAVPNIDHYTYDYYTAYYTSKYYFFDLLNNPKFFTLAVSNDLYNLYKIVSPIPNYFYGIYSVELANNTNNYDLLSHSAFGQSQSLQLLIKMDFSMVQYLPSLPQINLTYQLQNGTHVSLLYNISSTNLSSDFQDLAIKLPSVSGNFSLQSISLTDPINPPLDLLSISNLLFPPNQFISSQNITEYNVSAPLQIQN